MKNKNLSYFANQKKIKGDSLTVKSPINNVVWDVLIVFFLVVIVAVCLRLINDTFFTQANYKSWLIKTAYAAEENQAFLFSQTHTYVNIKPETGFTFTLKFQNTGDTTWTRNHVYLKSKTTALKFRHEFWPDPFLPATLAEEEVAPGEIGTFKFALQSPVNYNLYDGEFLLVNDNVLIKGGECQVQMNVVADPANASTPQTTQETTTQTTTTTTTPITNTSNQTCTLDFRTENLSIATTGVDNVSCVEKFNLPAQGPLMRVGLFYTEEIITIKNTKSWQVLNQNNTVLANIDPQIEISFFYDNETKNYSFDYNGNTVRTSSYLKLKNPDGMYTITSYHNIPSYNPNIDYNDFVGDLEIRHNDSKDRTWVIEELPMEKYLKGIQETTNYDPMEYLKTMAVAARTYASYHYDRYSKHADEYFHVDSRYDQVYKGYVSELLFPRVAEAVDATSGIVATYDDKVIVAPYFSHSDGRTRSYEEVWIYEVPYLISKPAPYSDGMDMFGHGVGIDAYDAKMRAKHDSWNYDDLLKYYYTGITLEQIW